MTRLAVFIKYNLIKQIRSYHFMVIVILSVVLTVLCMPASDAGYEIIYISGVRGIYNSTWLGAMGAILPVILLWLPGFYLLRSQISEDRTKNVGEIIASTQISKLSYIVQKAISNFCILFILEVIFFLAIIVMQMVRVESLEFSILDYLMPLLFVVIPYTVVLAALTILFDVVAPLKETFGNILIFALWIGLSTFSVAAASKFDLYGIGFLLDEIRQGAKAAYPDIVTDAISFGFYHTKKASPTFILERIIFEKGFLLYRFVWIGISALLVAFSSFLFDRFKNINLHQNQRPQKEDYLNLSKQKNWNLEITLTPITHLKKGRFFSLLKGECLLSLKGISIWWYITLICAMVIYLLIPSADYMRWGSLVLLLPIPIWSQLGCRERLYAMEELIKASCSLKKKWLSDWMFGVLFTFIVSATIYMRAIWEQNWDFLMTLTIGVIFVPTLAITLGTISKNKKLFEAVYIAWFYFGPISGIKIFDFLGINSNVTWIYAGLSFTLFCIGFRFVKNESTIMIRKSV